MGAFRLAVCAAVAGATLAGPAGWTASGLAATPSGPSARPAAAASHDRAVPWTGILPPHNPSRSLPPVPFFLTSSHCRGGQDGPRCNTLVLRAIARARSRLEHMRGMSFSLAAYERLRPIEQLFVTVNLERISRGLRPALELTKSLDKIAQAGANADTDPDLRRVPHTLPGGGQPRGEGGNWAGGADNALGSDYGWMYDDGLHSPNAACSRAHRAGCWGHRDIILGSFFNSAQICGGGPNELVMGAGHIRSGKLYGDSETELLVGVCGPVPTDVVFTWAKAKRLLHIRHY